MPLSCCLFEAGCKYDFHHLRIPGSTHPVDVKTIVQKNPVSLENRCVNLCIGFKKCFSCFCLVVLRGRRSLLSCRGKGCQVYLNRTWNDGLERMLAKHAAQTRVFIVFVASNQGKNSENREQSQVHLNYAEVHSV